MLRCKLEFFLSMGRIFISIARVGGTKYKVESHADNFYLILLSWCRLALVDTFFMTLFDRLLIDALLMWCLIFGSLSGVATQPHLEVKIIMSTTLFARLFLESASLVSFLIRKLM